MRSKRFLRGSLALSFALLIVPFAEAAPLQPQLSPNSVLGEGAGPATSSAASSGTSVAGGAAITRNLPPAIRPTYDRPFSRIAAGAGFSPMGIELQTVSDISRRFNLRATGAMFAYSASGFNADGFNVAGHLSLSSMRASVDYYPFRNGFRISPGGLFYNGNRATASFSPEEGTSFSLNDHTYYSATGADAVKGTGAFGLGNGSPAFTITTGWGNVLHAGRRHLSFPIEAGVAFIKQPTVELKLSGFVCDAQGENCVNVATDPTAQADIEAQAEKYRNNLSFLKTYPILSVGVAYNFKIRHAPPYW